MKNNFFWTSHTAPNHSQGRMGFLFSALFIKGERVPEVMKPVRKIIHIDMDAFYAAVEQQDRPELKGKPVIVGGDPQGRGVVATCSYEAREYGIHSAMAASRAYRLCPHAEFLRPRFDRYREISATIMTIFDKYFNRSKSSSERAVPFVKIIKHLFLNSPQSSSNFGKRNGSPPARKKQNTPSSLASEMIDFQSIKFSWSLYFLLCSNILWQVISEAAAKHPEQLRLHCCVRLSINVGGTFNPLSSNSLRRCLVSVKAR